MVLSEKDKFRFQLMVVNDVVGYRGVILIYDEYAGLGVNLMGGAAVYNLLDYNFPSQLTKSLVARKIYSTPAVNFDYLIDGSPLLAEKIFGVSSIEDFKVAYPDIGDAPNLILNQFLTSNDIAELDSRIIRSWESDNNLTLKDVDASDLMQAKDIHFGGAALDEFTLDRASNFLQATNLFLKTISNG